MTEIVLQWTPEHGPRRKQTITRTDDEWVRIETVWDGQQWCETGYERIENPTIKSTLPDTNPTPPTLTELLDQIHHTWADDTPRLLKFETDQSIVIAATGTELRYYSQRSTCWHPIDTTELRRLTQAHGLPELTTLEKTPYDRSDLERGGADA